MFITTFAQNSLPKCGKCHFKDTKILKIERGQPHAPRPTKNYVLFKTREGVFYHI